MGEVSAKDRLGKPQVPLSGALVLRPYYNLYGGGKMDIGAIQGLISNLGFPIACVIAMFWMMNKEREDHKEEMKKVTEALNNNTLALTELRDMISK